VEQATAMVSARAGRPVPAEYVVAACALSLGFVAMMIAGAVSGPAAVVPVYSAGADAGADAGAAYGDATGDATGDAFDDDSSSETVAPASGAFMTLQEAYLQGFADAKDSKPSQPPSVTMRAFNRDGVDGGGGGGGGPTYAAPPATSGGSFGLGSIFSLLMVASLLYKNGGGGTPAGWSPQVSANAAGPCACGALLPLCLPTEWPPLTDSPALFCALLIA